MAFFPSFYDFVRAAQFWLAHPVYSLVADTSSNTLLSEC